MKRPDWGLTPAALAWFDGCPFEELEERTDATPGDVCRVFWMAVQLMRNVRHAIDPDWDLAAGLREAVGTMNREEIDARSQLQLGHLAARRKKCCLERVHAYSLHALTPHLHSTMC